MNTQEELIAALHDGKEVTNEYGDPLVFIEGQLVATDKFGVVYPVYWLDPQEWRIRNEES